MLIGFIILDELDIIVFSRTNYDEFKIKLPENTERTSLLNSKILSFINNLQQVVENDGFMNTVYNNLIAKLKSIGRL